MNIGNAKFYAGVATSKEYLPKDLCFPKRCIMVYVINKLFTTFDPEIGASWYVATG